MLQYSPNRPSGAPEPPSGPLQAAGSSATAGQPSSSGFFGSAPSAQPQAQAQGKPSVANKPSTAQPSSSPKQGFFGKLMGRAPKPEPTTPPSKGGISRSASYPSFFSASDAGQPATNSPRAGSNGAADSQPSGSGKPAAQPEPGLPAEDPAPATTGSAPSQRVASAAQAVMAGVAARAEQVPPSAPGHPWLSC